MNATDTIRLFILNELRDSDAPEGFVWPDEVTETNLDDTWEAYERCEYGSEWLQESLVDFRSSYTDETGLRCDSSRHYESKAVARQIGEVWVGWTYWYGGGKHGNPGSIDWIDGAYFVTRTVEMRPVNLFTRPD